MYEFCLSWDLFEKVKIVVSYIIIFYFLENFGCCLDVWFLFIFSLNFIYYYIFCNIIYFFFVSNIVYLYLYKCNIYIYVIYNIDDKINYEKL